MTGLVIGDRPLDELVPLYRDPRSPMPVTQFNMKWVESAGLVKFDFLGLKTLTVLERAGSFWRRAVLISNLNPFPSMMQRPSRCCQPGIRSAFSSRSAGMRDVLKGLKPDSLRTLSLLSHCIARDRWKISRTMWRASDPCRLPTCINWAVLAETFGIMIYQEQVQQAARILAGYTLGGADLLRRAMGKKIRKNGQTAADLCQRRCKNGLSNSWHQMCLTRLLPLPDMVSTNRMRQHTRLCHIRPLI